MANAAAPAQQFVLGWQTGLTFIADNVGGPGQPVSVFVTSQDVDDGGDLAEVSSTAHLGQQAFIAAVQRLGGNIALNFDVKNVLSAYGIRFGMKAFFQWNVTSTNPWAWHVIIPRVAYKMPWNNVISVGVEIKSDALSAAGTVLTAVSYPS